MLQLEMLVPILDTIPSAIKIVDNKGYVLFANKKYLELTGLQLEELMNKNIFQLVPDGALAQAILNNQMVKDIHASICNNVEVISSAYPITIDNKLAGAMEILQLLDDYVMAISEVEKIMIVRALHVYGRSMKGKIKSADTLNISLATLYNKIKKYKL